MDKRNAERRPGDDAAAAMRRRAEEIALERAPQSAEAQETFSHEDARRTLHDLRVHEIELEMQNDELRRVQADLDIVRARYFDLFNLAPVGYCTISENGLVQETNLAAAGMLGVARGTLENQPISRFILRDDQDIYYLTRRRLLETGETQDCDLRMSDIDGATFDAHWMISATRGVEGATPHRIVMTDITERKKAEESARRDESRLRRLVDILQHAFGSMQDLLDYALDQAIQLTDSEMGCIYRRRTGADSYFLSASAPHVEADDAPDCSATDPAWTWGEAIRQRKPIVTNAFPIDGGADSVRPECMGHVSVRNCVAVPIFEGEKIVGVVGVANKGSGYDEIDVLQVSLMMGTVWKIAERMLAEQQSAKLEGQLLQSQKMESVGRLAGGVAHDFNNMLGVILGHVELAMDGPELAESLSSSLLEIRKAAQRSAALTKQLLAFARKQTATPQVIDLNKTVEGMLNMLRRLIGEDIDLAWLPGEDLWPTKVDPSQIDQILANLCVNARDAIADLGKISIETENCVVDGEYYSAQIGCIPGDYVRLLVTDTGCGMDNETLCHIFEPFFTTKAQGKGTGLGLAMVYGIVRQNNGFINAYSEPGIGTTFKIYLPRHSGTSAGPPEEIGFPRSDRGTETILLVEDEPANLDMIATVLSSRGYHVLATGSPVAALRLAAERAGDFQLLITDVVMPEMNGRDLATRLMALYPQTKRLFMSGYTADVIASRGILDEGVSFIQKPFSIKELAAKVREVLDRK